MKDWFAFGVTPLDLVLRAVLVFTSVLLLLRLSGKRQMGQMSPTEFVAILLISNAVQNAMNGGDNSLVGGMILASTLIFMSWLISMATYRYRWARMMFEGTPTVVVLRGKVIVANLRRERITESELRSRLRRQGFHRYEDIQVAILEEDGILSVERAEIPRAPAL